MIPLGILAAAHPRTGGGATYSGWNVSSLPADVTASNSNRTLTRAGGTNSTRVVRHGVSRSSGKYALRFLVTKSTSANAPAVGFAVSSGLGSFLGGNAAGWGLWPDNSGSNERAWHNNASTNMGNLGAPPIELMMELDLDNGRAFLGAAGAWPLSQNPATGANPIYTGISSPVEICADMYYLGSVTLLIPSEFTTPASAGYTPGWPD